MAHCHYSATVGSRIVIVGGCGCKTYLTLNGEGATKMFNGHNIYVPV